MTQSYNTPEIITYVCLSGDISPQLEQVFLNGEQLELMKTGGPSGQDRLALWLPYFGQTLVPLTWYEETRNYYAVKRAQILSRKEK